MFRDEIYDELTRHMLPFWQGLRDDVYGGYYGWLDIDLNLNKEAEKGCILNSRILWFFSMTAGSVKGIDFDEVSKNAEHAYLFLRDHFLDREYGGVYWSVDHKGNPLDTTKHTYNQAFAVYALATYYSLTGCREALKLAYSVMDVIESRCRDEYGYCEAFSREFQPLSNEKLSENGVLAEKTMNTLLHVFEAYSALYNYTGDPKVAARVRAILDLFADKVYNPEKGRLEVFFDRQWKPLIDLYSYGHDIEAAWLIERSLRYLQDETYTAKCMPIVKTLIENIYNRAYTNHSILLEAENGVVDTTRVWWVQCEAIVGFMTMYDYYKYSSDMSGYENGVVMPEYARGQKKYLAAAKDIWAYTKKYLIDKRPGSEWYWQVDENGVPSTRPIVEPWKCPYHAGRMCIEVMKILETVPDFLPDLEDDLSE